MDAALVAQLRADLVSSDFTVDRITALWGPDADAALHRGRRLPAERALDALPSHRAATLARLFILGLAVDRSALDAALPGLGSAGAQELGLVRAADGGRVSPAVDLRPYAFADSRGPGEWWIMSDLGELALGRPLDEDHVLGVGGASMTLSGLIVPREGARALDLGTGCGIQALHLSRLAAHVVATDISERAIAIARFNAELNGIAGIEFRLGDLFEPVAGERFDLIVSNPPFVITPRASGIPSYEYRDGGMVGDSLVEAVICGCARHLAPGGIAQLLGNWEYSGQPGGDGLLRVAQWIDDAGAATDDGLAGIDAWVIERESLAPAQYAETWIRDSGTIPGTPSFERLYAAWLDDFALRGVTAVGFGYVLLRRADPAAALPRLRRLERVGSAIGENGRGLGAHLLACLLASDWQRARDDDELAAARLVVAPDVTEERHLRPGDDDPSVILLRQGGGFGRTVQVDTALAAAVGACDGSLEVGAITAAIADLLEADESELRSHLLDRIRALIDDGMLAPA
jgi:SAM-dependent methyltransferase